MAQRQVAIGGGPSAIERLLAPSASTFVLLVLAGAALGQLAWHFLDLKLLAYASGIAGPLCMLCTSAVWAMRDKADKALGGEGKPAAEFVRFRQKAVQWRRRSMGLAACTALCALMAMSPSISLQLAMGVWHWMPVAGGVAVALALYAYLVAYDWDEQLIAFRDRQQYQQRLAAETEASLKRIRDSKPIDDGPPVGWTLADEPLTSAPKPH